MDAFDELGAEGAPALVQIIEEADRQDVRLGAGEFLRRLGPDAGDAAGVLAKIAADSTRSQALRLDVLRILGRIGAAAAPARDVLMPLLRSRGDEQREVAVALAAIGGTDLAEVYAVILAPPEARFDGVVTDRLEQIESDPYEERLSQIGLLGERGRDAIPALVRLLAEPHPNLRVHAARVLGFVGDTSAGPHLVALLRDEDWLMVRNAVESLARIGYSSARDEIALVARTHWYPGVRKVARDAVAALDGQRRYERYEGSHYFYLDTRGLGYSAPNPCATPARYPVESTEGDHFGANRSPERAKQFSYRYEADGDGGHDQIPEVGHRGPRGWFLGSSRGERGGELVWRPDDGRDQVILKDNIEDVYELAPGKLVVTAGLAHGDGKVYIDSGQVYRLEATNGRWRARWWLRLPGMPIDSWRTGKGDVVINTADGSVVLDRNGGLRMADCTTER